MSSPTLINIQYQSAFVCMLYSFVAYYLNNNEMYHIAESIGLEISMKEAMCESLKMNIL